MSDFAKVQRGICDYGASGDAGGAVISAVTVAKSFPRITNVRHSNAGRVTGGATTTLNNDDLGETTGFAATSVVGFLRYAGGEDVDHRVFFEVLEYIGAGGGPNEWLLRTLTEYTVADGTTDHATGAVSSISDWTRCAAFICGVRNNRGGVAWSSSAPTVEIQSDKTLRIRRGNGTGELKITVAVLEFPGANWQVETFSGAITAAGSRVALSMSGAIERWDRAFIVPTMRTPSAENADCETGAIFVPGSGLDEVDAVLSSAADNAAGGGYVAYGYVIASRELTVLHDNSHDGGLAEMATGDGSKTFTIPAEQLDETMLFCSAYAPGTLPTYPRPHIGYQLAGTTSVELWRGRSGSVIDWALQVVAFRRTTYPDAGVVEVGAPSVTLDLPRAQAPDAGRIEVMAPDVELGAETEQLLDAVPIVVGAPTIAQVNNGGPIENLAYLPQFVLGFQSTPISPLMPSYTGADATIFECLPSAWSSHKAPKLGEILLAFADFEIQGPAVAGAAKGRVIRLSDGAVFSDLDYPTIEAIKMAFPGAVIRVNSPGQVPDVGTQGYQIGGGDAGIKKYRADWVGTPWEGLPIDVTIIGANPGRVDFLRGHGFPSTIGGVPSGGIDGIRFENLTLRVPPGGKAVVECGLGTYNKLAIYRRCNFIGAGDGTFESFGGSGMQFGIRSQGLMRWHVEECHFGALQDGTQPPGSLDTPGCGEHCWYLDGPQGNCYFIGNTMERTFRTMGQIVNRKFEQDAAGGQSGFGVILVENCHAYNIQGAGGGAFTVAGHLGTVIFRGCSVTEGPDNLAHFSQGPCTLTGTPGSTLPAGATLIANDAGQEFTTDAPATIGAGGTATVDVTATFALANYNLGPGETLQVQSPPPGVNATATVTGGGLVGGHKAESYAAITCYADIGKGVYENPNGYAIDRVVIEDLTCVLPNCERDVVNVSGTEEVEVYGDFDLTGINGKTAFDFNGNNEAGGVYPNGVMRFRLPSPASSYAGFPSVNKVKVFDVVLPDVTIDALQADPETLPPGLSIDSETGEISGTPTATFEPALRYIRATNAEGWDATPVGFWLEEPLGPTSQSPPAIGIEVGAPAVDVDGAVGGGPTEENPDAGAIIVGAGAPTVVFEPQSETVRVQRGVLEYGSAADFAVQALPLGAVGSLTRAFPRLTNVRRSNAGRTSASTAELTNADLGETIEVFPGGTHVAVQRYAAGENVDHRLHWELAEWIGPVGAAHPDEWTVVASGELVFAPTQNTLVTTPFTGIVDVTRTIAIVTGARSIRTAAAYSSSEFTVEIGLDKRLTIRRGSSTGDAVVSVALIEFLGSNWTVHRVTHESVADGAWEAAALAAPVARWSQAFILGSMRVPSGADDNNEGGFLARPGSALDEIEIRVASGADAVASGGYVFEGWVVESPSITVLHDDSVDGGLAQVGLTDLTLEHVLADEVDPLSTLALVTAYSAGNAPAYPIPHVGYRLKSSVRVELWRSRVGNRLDWALQLVEFRRELFPDAGVVAVGSSAPTIDLPTAQAPAAGAVAIVGPSLALDLPTEQTLDAAGIVVVGPRVETDLPTVQSPDAGGVVLVAPELDVDLPTEQALDAGGVVVGAPDVSLDLPTAQAPAAGVVTVGAPVVDVEIVDEQFLAAGVIDVVGPAVSVSYETAQAPDAGVVSIGAPAVAVDLPTEQALAAGAAVVGAPDVSIDLPTAQAPAAGVVTVGAPAVTVDLPLALAPDAGVVSVIGGEVSVSLATVQEPDAGAIVVGAPAVEVNLPTEQALAAVGIAVVGPSVTVTDNRTYQFPDAGAIAVVGPAPSLDLGAALLSIELEVDVLPIVHLEVDLL